MKDLPVDIQEIEKANDQEYNSNAFDSLLNWVTDTVKKYDGLRVYFGVYPAENSTDSGSSFISKGKANTMTLIFVPTHKEQSNNSENCGKDCHEDDITNCMIIVDNKLYHLDCSNNKNNFISDWVRKYQSKRAVFFESSAIKNRNYDTSYKETKSIWYNIYSIRRDTASKHPKGLIDYLEYFQRKYNTVNLKIKFAGFLGSPRKRRINKKDKFAFAYQLSLIYNFKAKHKKINKIIFSHETKSKDKLYSGGNTDTGVPCPPPPPGSNTCPGSLLPQKTNK
jgi:hypothetical protein